jgi:hypothetical protein
MIPDDKMFPITSICKQDIKDTGNFNPEDIDMFDDGDMGYIANKMSDAYMDGGGGFWEDMAYFVEKVLKDKKKGS